MNGFKYFDAFDKDKSIKKDYANRLNLTLTKLSKGRNNVAICSEREWDAIKVKNPKLASKFKLATYKYDKPNPVYFGISKKSWLGKQQYLPVFEKVIKEMNEKHEFVEIIANFYESYAKNK